MSFFIASSPCAVRSSAAPKEMTQPLSGRPACHLFGCERSRNRRPHRDPIAAAPNEMAQPLSDLPASHLFGAAPARQTRRSAAAARSAAPNKHAGQRACHPVEHANQLKRVYVLYVCVYCIYVCVCVCMCVICACAVSVMCMCCLVCLCLQLRPRRAERAPTDPNRPRPHA